MSFCNIETSFIGNKLNEMFYPENRNKIANLMENSDFKKWFGQGRIDKEGNPVIDETLSFTNEKGEKKVIFDFPGINFQNTGEVKKLLKSFPTVNVYKSELFINNTVKGVDGRFLAQDAIRLINTINYYYPDLLTIDQYNRTGISQYSKNKAIPLPIIRVNDDVKLTNSGGVFSAHFVDSTINRDRDKFNQLRAVDVLEELKDGMDEFRNYGLSVEDTEKIVAPPEVSPEAYERLVGFVKKINPTFRVEEVNNLSADGIAYISDFLIQVNTGAKLRAMPEEVAHFFVELLPKHSELRKDLIDNITNFAIYSTTLNTYKSIKEYQLDNGNINYDKIKREAAAKLIAEYVYALSEEDNSRLALVTKTKDGFIKRWWDKFVNFVKGIFKLRVQDALKSYLEAAKAILNDKIEYLSLGEVTKDIDNEIFFSISEDNKVLMAQSIMSRVLDSGKIDDLQKVVDNFKRDLQKNFIKIVKDDAFSALNKELEKENGIETEINYLSGLYDIIKNVDVTGKDLVDMLKAENQILNLSEFLSVIANMERLAKAIDIISDNYIDTKEYLKNIAELQAFRGVYSNFKAFVESDLMRILVDSGVETDIITTLNSTTAIFDAVELKILRKLRDNYSEWMKNTVAPQNAKIVATISSDLQKALERTSADAATKIAISEGIKKYISDLQGSTSLLQSRKNLITTMESAKIPKKILNSRLISQILDKIGGLYVTNQAVDDLLRGLGKDIDPMSFQSHIVTAAIKNADMILSDVATFIVKKKSASQLEASLGIRELQAQVDPIIKKLKASHNIDEYKAGEAITYIDDVVDETKDKNGNLNYEGGIRKIVKFVSPVLNSVMIETDRLLKVKNELRRKLNEMDVNSQEYKDAKKAYSLARKEHLSYRDKYWNSPFNDELQAFQRKWNQDEDFLEIKDEWDILSSKIKDKKDMLEGDKNSGSTPDYSDLISLLAERSLLINENKRTGKELEQTKLLKQFFEESNKFRIEDTRQTERNYKLGRNNYEAKLDYALADFFKANPNENDRTLDKLEDSLRASMKDPNLSIKYKYQYNVIGESSLSESRISSEDEARFVKAILLLDWENANNVKVRNEKFVELDKKIRETIERLKSLKQLSPIDLQVSNMYKEMNDMLIGRKDEYGQRNPDLLTPAEKAKLDELEDKITFVKNFKVTVYDISDEQRDKPSNKGFVDYINTYRTLSQELFEYFEGKRKMDLSRMEDIKAGLLELNKGFLSFGVVTDEQIEFSKDMKILWQALANMTDKKPTQIYMEKIEELVPLIDTILQDSLREKTNNPLWSEEKLKLVDGEINNLVLLLNGLKEAIYSNNYRLLDQIMNDEYFVDGVKVDFKKYIEETEQGIAEPSPIEELDEEFFNWFHTSHKFGSAYIDEEDPITGEILRSSKFQEREYTRRMYYVYSEPSDMDPSLFDVKHSQKYRATKINDDPVTGYYSKQITWRDSDNLEDWTVDNKEGRPQYLPLSRKQRLTKGDKNTTHLNEKFYNLIDGKGEMNGLLNNYLSTSLKTYFNEQASKPDEIKSMFNLPVTALDAYQRLKADVTNTPDRIKRAGQKIKGIFTPSKDTDAEDMHTGIDQMRDTNEITQDLIRNKIPALGMNTKIPVERVNRNVLHALTEYITNSKDFNTRSDLQPFVKGLIDVMKYNESTPGHQNQKGRTKIFDQIYSQMILQELPDNITNSRQFRKFAGYIMRLTGWKLTADLVGGSINYIQANINNLVESFASQHASPRNYATGYMRASEMIGSLFIDFNKKSDYSYWTLMYETFDFVQGEWKDDLADRSSTKSKKFDWKRMLMYPRTNGELHAQSAMALAILDNQKIKNSIDGKMYPMWNIYRKEGSKLVLKEGFDNHMYNPVNGTMFEATRNKIWSVNIDLHGNYAKINQTEASRHSIGKLAENMKRWFSSGFQRRFGREFFDVNTNELNQGYYTTTGLMVWNTIAALTKEGMTGAKGQFSYYFNTPRKMANLKRFLAEGTICILLFLMGSLVFGYDGDDPDKNKKLAQSSWLHNELLLITLRSFAEQTAYYPVPPLGFTEMTRNLLDPFSVAKSAFGNLVGAGTLAMYTAGYYLGKDSWEDDAFYQKDTGSIFGHKGNSKFAHYLLKTLGYTGAQLDPAFYIRNFQSLQNRLK